MVLTTISICITIQLIFSGRATYMEEKTNPPHHLQINPRKLYWFSSCVLQCHAVSLLIIFCSGVIPSILSVLEVYLGHFTSSLEKWMVKIHKERNRDKRWKNYRTWYRKIPCLVSVLRWSLFSASANDWSARSDKSRYLYPTPSNKCLLCACNRIIYCQRCYIAVHWNEMKPGYISGSCVPYMTRWRAWIPWQQAFWRWERISVPRFQNTPRWRGNCRPMVLWCTNTERITNNEGSNGDADCFARQLSVAMWYLNSLGKSLLLPAVLSIKPGSR